MFRNVENRSKLNFALGCEVYVGQGVGVVLREGLVEVVVLFLLYFLLGSIPDSLNFINSFPFPNIFPNRLRLWSVILIFIIFYLKIILFKSLILLNIFFIIFFNFFLFFIKRNLFFTFFTFFTFFFIFGFSFFIFFSSWILYYFLFIFFLLDWNFSWDFFLYFEVNWEVNEFWIFLNKCF